MIWTDGVHLMTDGNIDELHAFAIQIGLKREWFQNHRHPHYDTITRGKARRAIAAGATVVSSRELVVKCRKTE